MIKVIAGYLLPEGTDPEEFWKYHTEVHAADCKKAYGPRLKKYTVNRVVKVLKGDPGFFALMEDWFEDEAALKEADKSLKSSIAASGKNMVEDFSSRVIKSFRVIVEEKEIEV